LWRKFGINMGQLTTFWQATTLCPHVDLMGLQFHTSWNMSAQPQINFIQLLGAALKQMPEAFQKALRFIDIGGGYWPGRGEWLHPRATPRGRLLEALGAPEDPPQIHHCMASLAIEAFAGQIAAAIKEHLLAIVDSRICLEPGRWICNDAMHLLLSVVDKKAPDLVITDAGTNAIGWERFESDYFPVLNLSRPSLIEKPCHILGSLCTPHDVWGYMYFGETIEPGDILMIPTQGAYTYSLRQEFIKPIPEVVVI
jgi:diaminopimelate decarboxylase